MAKSPIFKLEINRGAISEKNNVPYSFSGNLDIKIDINNNPIKTNGALNLTGRYIQILKDLSIYAGSFFQIIMIIYPTSNSGRINILNNSASGGHNGLKSITKAIQTRDYVRFKIGIYGKDRMIDAIDCVLGKFSKEQRKVLDEVYDKVGNLLEDFVNCDIARLKQIYNSMNKKNDL